MFTFSPGDPAAYFDTAKVEATSDMDKVNVLACPMVGAITIIARPSLAIGLFVGRYYCHFSCHHLSNRLRTQLNSQMANWLDNGGLK
ncbi:hypothetical protein GCM10011502_20610 [Oceanisphaera marina]|uniref:Uncharacterized protein n=1 Tax=Oceanisphaera marina TaxID=2017550 RepID=A0ABQ1IQ07_9GAMM|nr:hypothetical protein GCM10011502_20610 [Oceanisphaera marina]